MPEQQNPEQQLEYLKELRKKYEEVLKDAEKTGDYSEAEKLKLELEKRLTVLETVMGANNLENQEAESKEVTETRAREIMGEDFFGFEEIHKAFGDDLSLVAGVSRPEIHYSEQTLKEAKANGEMLILRVGEDKEGEPVTLKRLIEIINSRMTEAESKFFVDRNLYWKEKFFTEAATTTRWTLVKKEFVLNSTGKDYIEQTKVLRDYLKNLNALTTEEFEECNDSHLSLIRRMMTDDVDYASYKLTALGVNKNHRRSPVEALYDWILESKNDNGLTLEHVTDWTNAKTSNGALVTFGDIGNSTFSFRSQGALAKIYRNGVIPVR